MRLSLYRSVTFKLCFDDQRSEHSFVADRSDINLVDDGNNATSVRYGARQLTRAIVQMIAVRGTLL